MKLAYRDVLDLNRDFIEAALKARVTSQAIARVLNVPHGSLTAWKRDEFETKKIRTAEEVEQLISQGLLPEPRSYNYITSLFEEVAING